MLNGPTANNAANNCHVQVFATNADEGLRGEARLLRGGEDRRGGQAEGYDAGS